MIFYYAVGGGLGHFTRARAVLHTLFRGKRSLILTSTDAAGSYPKMDNVGVLVVPNELRKSQLEYRRFLQRAVDENRPSIFCVDSFPNGLFGELNDVHFQVNPQRMFAGRILKWNAYDRLNTRPALPFDQVYVCEKMSADGRSRVRKLGNSLIELELQDPPNPKPNIDVPESYWLVDHSGPASEVSDLADLARAHRVREQSSAALWINTQSDFAARPNELRTSIAPSSFLYAGAARLFTGAGYNAVRQANSVKVKHTVLPFRRRFDDQPQRAKLHGLFAIQG